MYNNDFCSLKRDFLTLTYITLNNIKHAFKKVFKLLTFLVITSKQKQNVVFLN